MTMHPRDSFWISGEADAAAEEIDSALPIVIGSGLRDAPWESVDDVFARLTERLSPPETEGIGSALRTIGKWASRAQLDQLAGKLAPVAGAAAGTAIGGPVGTMIGKSIGDKVGQMAGGSRPAGAPAAVPPGMAPVVPAATIPPAAPTTGTDPGAAPPPTGTTAPPTGGESQAAARLLYLVQNPAFLSSLVSLALGSAGQPTVPAGPDGTPVRVGAFMNLATTLAGKAAEDADALAGDAGSDGAEAYIAGADGCPSCDPAIATERADALLAFLQRQDAGEALDDSGEASFEDRTRHSTTSSGGMTTPGERRRSRCHLMHWRSCRG